MRFDEIAALENRALFATAPFLTVPREELEATREILLRPSRVAADSAVAAGSFLTPHRGFHESLRTYLSGTLAACLGDHEAALELAAEFEGHTSPAPAPTATHDLASGIRARAAWEQGDAAEALRLLERTRLEVAVDLSWGSPFFSHGHERLLRAGALEALGRDEEALAWYGSFTGIFSPYDLIYAAPSYLRQAEIYERLGQLDEAIAHYARFVELWQDCDPELRPLVEDAERRLQALAESAASP